MRRAAALLALPLAALPTAACSGEGATVTGEAPAPGSAYVAIGDSYTAAPGIGASLDDACGRSAGNYPSLVAAALDLELTDVSCSGALTVHVSDPQYVGDQVRAPQGDALGAGTDLVTVSLGANDDGVFGGLLGCVPQAAADPTGSPCRDHYLGADLDGADLDGADLDGAGQDGLAPGGVTPAEGAVDRLRVRLAGRVAAAVGAVQRRAPRARVLVVGYPVIAPTETCPQFPLATGDVAFVAEVNAVLNDALAAGAAERGADFVDLTAPTEGHDLCSADPWVAGQTPTGPATPYHPYVEEQQAAAAAIVAALSVPEGG
ncbi:SGNH/GDSL hydrolase family protein [Nocardioides sp. YIM 152588]|uniref:SGNH/GDSL hydrolase family protein n=1 Tax=Nocardioides sp. YIM 152588 TaxID=3158259 RepID=UPI0032E4561A